jgi:hypothetical protein
VRDLPTYSKLLNPADFNLLDPELGFLYGMKAHLAPAPPGIPHPSCFWEYALALRCCTRSDAQTVLDVGGGGGLFSPAAARCGADVTQIDPGDCAARVAAQGALIGQNIRFGNSDLQSWREGPYDVVACLSVIEHVGDDFGFADRLLGKVRPGGLLVLTADFHPTGKRLVGGHLRTYSESSLRALMALLGRLGRPYDAVGCWRGEPDWSHFSPWVYDYTFASLVLRRNP